MSLEYNLNQQTLSSGLTKKRADKKLFAKLINTYTEVSGNDYVLKIKENNG